MDEQVNPLTRDDWAVFLAQHKAANSNQPPAKREDDEPPAPREDDKPLPKLTPIRFVEGEILPPREWIVYDGWIPTRKVSLIQGDGGDGKTSLMQQLQSSFATALPWLGLRAEKGVSVGFFTQGEGRDLQKRHAGVDAPC